MKNLEKDVKRGAANCDVLQEGRSESNHAHVKRVTPLATKIEELKNAAQYQDGAIDTKREKSTSRKRADKDVKSI
jgi:hypothetical protein